MLVENDAISPDATSLLSESIPTLFHLNEYKKWRLFLLKAFYQNICKEIEFRSISQKFIVTLETLCIRTYTDYV